MIHAFISNAPPRLTGAQFEELVLFRGRQMNEAGQWDMGRYGVQVSMMAGPDGKLVTQPLKSLPDFEAAIPPLGRQVIFEAKVCSGASYPISAENERKSRQLRHLCNRARMGCLCYLLVHFNERALKRKVEEPFTVALPIDPDSELLQDVFRGGTKTLSRSEAMLYGRPIPWTTFGARGRKQTPDLSVLLRQE